MYSKMGGKTTTASWLGQSAFGAAASAAIFAGVQPSRLILRVWHAVRGRCPRLLTVQPSRLGSLACPGLCARCAFSPFAARAAIFAGVQPSRLILRVCRAVRGRCPRLLTVQSSRLDSLAMPYPLKARKRAVNRKSTSCIAKGILAWKAIL